MAKRYQILRDLVPTRHGGFVERLRIALVEFGCFGERRFDVAGYPYDSINDGLMSDWQALASDARAAIEKVAANKDECGGSSHGERTQAAELPAK